MHLPQELSVVSLPDQPLGIRPHPDPRPETALKSSTSDIRTKYKKILLQLMQGSTPLRCHQLLGGHPWTPNGPPCSRTVTQLPLMLDDVSTTSVQCGSIATVNSPLSNSAPADALPDIMNILLIKIQTIVDDACASWLSSWRETSRPTVHGKLLVK